MHMKRRMSGYEKKNTVSDVGSKTEQLASGTTWLEGQRFSGYGYGMDQWARVKHGRIINENE